MVTQKTRLVVFLCALGVLIIGLFLSLVLRSWVPGAVGLGVMLVTAEVLGGETDRMMRRRRPSSVRSRRRRR